MSDFLAGALSQARADLTLKRAAGTSAGKTQNIDGPRRKKAKWLDKSAALYKKNESALSDHDLERSRKALERKEKQYKKMFNRGTDMHLDGVAAENLLIDFDRKWAEGHRQEDSDDEEADARLASDDEDDPLIEVEDEFGRLRRVRKSEALRHEKPQVTNTRPANLIYGRHLQTFNPDAQKKDEIWAEEEASREVHYDPKFEIRQRGAGYINLGRGEDRRDRLDDLERAHMTTVHTRLDHGLTEPEPPPLVTIPHEEAVDERGTGGDYIHPSRRKQLPMQNSNEIGHKGRAREQERLKAGQAFLDSIM